MIFERKKIGQNKEKGRFPVVRTPCINLATKFAHSFFFKLQISEKIKYKMIADLIGNIT